MIFFALCDHFAIVQDTLFSGPQKGETATPFQAVGVREPHQGKVVEGLGEGVEIHLLDTDSGRVRSYHFSGKWP